MIYELNLLDVTKIRHFLNFYEFSNFQDGRFSGPKSKNVKNNKQMIVDEHYHAASGMFLKCLCDDLYLSDLLSVRKFGSIYFLKYDEGMHYGFHNDHYLMSGTRTDYSATCFLSSPDEYEGGELCIVVGNQELKFKPEAGKMIVYPTGLRHKVNEVTKGSRKVVVFWIESSIQNTVIRNMHSDLHVLWDKYNDRLLTEMPEVYEGILNLKFQLKRQFGNYEGLQ